MGYRRMPREAYYWYILALKDKVALKRALPTKDLVSETTEAFDRIGKSFNKKSIGQLKSHVDNWRSKRLRGQWYRVLH